MNILFTVKYNCKRELQMKITIGIPVIYCASCVSHCIGNIKNQDVELLFVDNNSDMAIKQLIRPYRTIVNPKNVYVNPAWNQLMAAFLESDRDLLIIMNSDLYVKHDLISKLKLLPLDEEKIIVCLNLASEFVEAPRTVTKINGGAAGVFLALTKAMVKLVYPIPDSIKLWFGDNWIYQRLQKHGYQLTIYSDLQAKHGSSASVSVLPEACEVIERDKVAWEALQQMI